jgi:hypothetical protein
MIISPQYGPQFDGTDGTIGPKVHLIKRWTLCTETREGGIWGGRNGQNTYATLEDAERRIAVIRKNNRPGDYPEDLHAVAWWCYPVHFDPAGRYEEGKI